MTPVEKIKERLSILEVIGAYVELTKAGRHYKGKSPFTSEKTPSFFVSPDRGMYYCFSSQKGGDIFTFIEEIEGVDFKGALTILADRAGVELVPEDPKKRTEREAQYALVDEATQFFFKEREKYAEATKYIESRGVLGKTLHVWRIGYAPPEWRALKKHLLEKKFTESQIQKAGLIKGADQGKESYDVFRDRIMFPICDSSGRVVAFSGRALHADEKAPKYVNSPETELFEKSKILYGYDKAKQGIRTFDFSLIVEGQFDVVLAHQAGYTNAVAVSGTALTPHHVGLLERLSTRMVLALDSDRAGIAAVKRSAAVMLKKGMDIKVAAMPEGKDPADIIQEDPKQFKKLIGSSVHVVEFLLNALKSVTTDERTYKLRAREEVIPLLASMTNHIDRDHFENVIAESIGVTKDAVHYEVERLVNAAANESHERSPEEPAAAAAAHTAKSTRRSALIKNLYATTLVLGPDQQALSDKITAHLQELLSDAALAHLEGLSKEEMSRLTFLAEEYIAKIPEKQLYGEIADSLTELSHLVARQWLSTLRMKIREAEKVGEYDVLEKYREETKRAESLLQNTITLAELGETYDEKE